MMRTTRGGHRLALVSITAVLTSLGSAPAFADEGPLVTVQTTTVDVAATTSTTVDEVSNQGTATVDEISDAADTTVDQLSDTTASAADAVDAVTATVDPVDALTAPVDAVDAAATTIEEVTGAATTVVDQLPDSATSVAGGNGSDMGSATAESSDRAGASSSHAGTSSDATQGASPLRSVRERTPLTLADGAEHPRWAVHDRAPCQEADGPLCSPRSGTSEEDSLAEKISEVIGLLALTGFMLLPWIAAALALTVLGSVALERARGRGSRPRRVSAA